MRGIRPRQFVMLLAVTGLLGACGSSGSSSGASTATNPSAVSGAPLKHQTPAQVARCKQTVATQGGLTAAVKSQLTALCAQSAHASPVAIRQAAIRICESVIGNSALRGDAKTQALAACKAA